MPQYFGLQVFDPTIRINQVAVRVLCDGINRQIAACQVLLKGNGRIRVANESAMALASLSLGARQGVFFLTLWVQEDRKVFTHRAVTKTSELLGRGAHDHPVSLYHRKIKESVSNRTAYKVSIQ